MEDRSNIIKEAIEYRDKLEKKVKELAQSVVRLQVSLDFADNTIKKKDREIAELEAYKDVNEDFKTAWEDLKAENERLKEKLATYGATGVCEVCSDKANKLADKYLGCLQEIKEIAKTCISKDACFECKYSDDCYIDDAEIPTYDICKLLIQLITKAESEG